MQVRAGERCDRDADVRCANCGAQAHVSRGHRVPKCRGCGYALFTG